MTAIVFTGVSCASLGELLKGYGIIAIVGSVHPNALFWWNEDSHLVARGAGSVIDRQAVTDAVREGLPIWAEQVGASFQKQRANKNKGIAGGSSPLETKEGHDTLSEDLAGLAQAVAVFSGGARARPHPLFPGLGQDGSANYFKTLQSEAKKLASSGKSKGKDKRQVSEDLDAALFGEGVGITRVLGGTGGLFFPGAIKRYATGSSWVHEKDAAVSGWDFLLAIRGALLLRGATRGFRGSRCAYPSFPFVFRGSPMKVGGKLFTVDDVFLPTWPEDRSRTLAEFQMQIRQFQARVGAGELASSSADFRRAVQGRGVAGGFDRFHRFVLERRKPGQRQPAVQAVARGVTTVGEGATDLRVLLSRLDESGWLDQLEQQHLSSKKRDEQLLLAARRVHDAIHACADEPTAHRHRAVLHALWLANSLLLTRGDSARVRPLPPLPSRGWEKVLEALFCESPEARIARALASIGWDGWDAKKKQWRPGRLWPIASQVLPVEYGASRAVFCRVPDPRPAQRVSWSGIQPETEFGRVFWRRWLDAAHQEEHDVFPYGATRFAPLADVLLLLRGSLDLRDVHRCCSAFFVLDWSRPAVGTTLPWARLPVPAAYAILRLWLETGIQPPKDGKPSWDGSVAQCLLRGDPNAIRSGCRFATSRLRVVGLPAWPPESTDRRAGRAVARPVPVCTADEAKRMLLAVLVPINSFDTEQLARCLWIPTSEDQQEPEESHA